MASSRFAVGIIACCLALGLNSCIVTYRDFPQEHMEAPLIQKKNFPLYYYSSPTTDSDRISRALPPGVLVGAYPLYVKSACGDPELPRELTDGRLFPEVIKVPAPPSKGIYYAVIVAQKKVSGALEVYSAASDPVSIFSRGLLRILPLLPVYSGEAGLLIRYDLYVNQELRKTYRYEITKKGISWIGVLPLAWVNLFTYTQKDACQATYYQFLTDAERDGYLREE